MHTRCAADLTPNVCSVPKPVPFVLQLAQHRLMNVDAWIGVINPKCVSLLRCLVWKFRVRVGVQGLESCHLSARSSGSPR